MDNLSNVQIIGTAHEGLQVSFNGRPAELAIVTPEGLIIASGVDVARSVEGVAVETYRNLLRGQGHLRTVA